MFRQAVWQKQLLFNEQQSIVKKPQGDPRFVNEAKYTMSDWAPGLGEGK